MANLFNPFNIFRRSASPASAATQETPATTQEPPEYSPRHGRIKSDSVMSLTGGGLYASLNVATVHRCVTVISNSVAALPLRVMNLRGAIYVPEVNSPLSWALEFEPNSEESAFNMMRRAIQDILLWGNAYLVPFFGGNRVTLRLCSPTAVNYDPYSDTYDVNDVLHGVVGRFPSYKVVHFRGLSIDGKTGVSVLTFARKSVDISAQGSKEQEKRFASGGTVRGVITTPDNHASFGSNTPQQMADAADYVEEQIDCNRKIIAVPADSKFTQMSMSSADMQFLQSRQFEVREICRFFGVHPSFVFDDTSNNYKSAETANAAFLTNTLNPILRNIETELTRRLLPVAARSGRSRIMFDRPAMFAMDLDARYKYQRARLETGTASVNELRREENVEPVSGGDMPLVSANLRAITEINQTTSQTNADN